MPVLDRSTDDVRSVTPAGTLYVPKADLLTPTVFHNRWWLEAASNGRYREIDVRSGGKVVAWMPYILNRDFGVHRLCHMPELTHFLGPAIDPGQGSLPSQHLRSYHLTQELLQQLGPLSGLSQKLHRDLRDTMAFEDLGYASQVEFTYEILPRPVEAIWKGMRDKTRNVIRRAQQRLEVSTMDDPYAFAATYHRNLVHRRQSNMYTRVGPVCEAALARQQGRILAVRDASGHPLAAIFIVWDHQAAYYLLSTRSPEADNGAISLLLWEAIRNAASANLIFDFDGLGPRGNRLFFTGFGGQIEPRYIVSKHRLSYRTLSAARRSVQHLRKRRRGSA